MKKQVLICLILLGFVNIKAISQFSKFFEFTYDNDLSYANSSPVFDGEYLYDVSIFGGTNGNGAIYKIKPDGSGYSKIFDFSSTDYSEPIGPLTLSNNVLYGVTQSDFHSPHVVCLYRINTDGSGFTILTYTGCSPECIRPFNPVTLFENVIYGTTLIGGSHGLGSVYRINADGTSSVLLDFDGTNGQHPTTSLTLSGEELYGITSSGGTFGCGCIYKIRTDGSGYCRIKDFNAIESANSSNGPLTISGGEIYGTLNYAGQYKMGYIFKLYTDGSGFSKILDFNGENGRHPCGSLTLSGNTLYGMTSEGGVKDEGCIFSINTDGIEYTKLLDFVEINGYGPKGSLLLLNNVLYGEANGGGGSGCLFKINIDGSGYYKLLAFHSSNNGRHPVSSLTISGNEFYGMTQSGGANDMGCIFKINTDGTGFSKLLDFNGTANGWYPEGSLTLSNGKLYGMTEYGGENGMGCIFKINTDGTEYTKLLNFEDSISGKNPAGSLTISGDELYGMTYSGGAYGVGCIFKINADGTEFAKLLDFNDIENGGIPYGSLTISGSVLYGMTFGGGANGRGCIFKINTDGTEYKKLLDFDESNGAYPLGSLTLSDSELYGMTMSGGTNEMGCIFKINTDGTGYSKLLDFNWDNGRYPYGSLTLSGNELYGMTLFGGTNDMGCLFKIKTDGSEYVKLLDFFSSTVDGAYPHGSLIYADSVIYGMTSAGGIDGGGILFKYALMTPTRQAKNITISNLTGNQADISWTKGNGYKCAAFVKMGSGDISNPTNKITYTASTDWISQGTQLDNSGYYCVYNDTGRTLTLTNLSPITQYSVQVFEYNGNQGAEQYQTITEVNNPTTFTTTKQNQTITFGTLSSKTLEDDDFYLDGTASSGLSLIYTSSNTNVATIDGNKVTITGVGSTNITAAQPGNNSYYPAISVMQPFNVVSVDGISEISSQPIKVYPNPTAGNLFIQSEIIMDNFYLFNLQGKKLDRSHLNSTTATIDINRFPSGFYIIKIHCRDLEYSYKIEKK